MDDYRSFQIFGKTIIVATCPQWTTQVIREYNRLIFEMRFDRTRETVIYVFEGEEDTVVNAPEE